MPRTLSKPSPPCNRTAGLSNTRRSSGGGEEDKDEEGGEANEGVDVTEGPSTSPDRWEEATQPARLAVEDAPLAGGAIGRDWHSWMDTRLQRKVVRKLREPALPSRALGAVAAAVAGVAGVAAAAVDDEPSAVALESLAPTDGVAGGGEARGCSAEVSARLERRRPPPPPSCVEATAPRMATCSAVRVSAAASKTSRSRDGLSSASKPSAFESHTPLSAAIAPSRALAASHGSRRMYRLPAGVAASAAGECGSAPTRHCQKLTHRVCAAGGTLVGAEGDARPPERGESRPILGVRAGEGSEEEALVADAAKRTSRTGVGVQSAYTPPKVSSTAGAPTIRGADAVGCRSLHRSSVGDLGGCIGCATSSRPMGGRGGEQKRWSPSTRMRSRKTVGDGCEPADESP